MFLLLARTEKTANTKSAQDDLQKASCNFSIFFLDPGSPKRENTTRVKECRESSPDVRAYARQPARGPLEGTGALEHKEELRLKDRNYRVFFGCHFFDLVDEDG